MTEYNLKSGISDDLYHADTGSLSSTGARKILACPARFKWERDHPPAPTTKAFDFGKLSHKLVLGEGSAIQIVEADNWLSKAAKEQRDAARADGAVPVLRSEYDTAKAMREAVMAHPVAGALFTAGSAELSGYWQDEPTDIRLRFRPDWLTGHINRVTCVDYKTTISANPDAIDSSSAPESILSSPNRSTNNRRTAGTKDEPPVRKTRSIWAGARDAFVSASSTAPSMAVSSRPIQPSKSPRATSFSMSILPALKTNRDCSSLDSASFSRETDW